MKKLGLHALVLMSLLATAPISPMASAQQRLPIATINIGIHLIQAELAIADEERAQGLMFREKMGQNEGMVFRFSSAREVCMWMKNTPLPLSVAFIDESGGIINIEDMQPHSTAEHCSKKPVRFVLEMNQGWFAKKGLKSGSKITGQPFYK